MHASSNYRKVRLDIKLDPFLNKHRLTHFIDGIENLFVYLLKIELSTIVL